VIEQYNFSSLILPYATNDTCSNQSQAGFKLTKPQMSQSHPPRICFITLGWQITCNLNLLSLTMGEGAQAKESIE
jgi:hypothetical protein